MLSSFCPYVYQMLSFFRLNLLKPCLHFCTAPEVPHDSPIISLLFSITECYLVSSTNYEAPRHAVFANLPMSPLSQCQTFPQTPHNNKYGGAATELNKALCVSASATAECRCRNGLCGSEMVRRLFVWFGQQLVLTF
jgi:hypothetical protein